MRLEYFSALRSYSSAVADGKKEKEDWYNSDSQL